jgi:diamine N-acetyltransferase
MRFLLRTCVPGDEIALSLIGQATILETYAGISEGTDLYAYVREEFTAERLATLLKSDRSRAWLIEAEPGRSAVGYAIVLSPSDVAPFSTSELQRFYVFFRFHGCGLGKMLMEAVLTDAASRNTELITLRVNAQNLRAIEFYRRYGFLATSEEPFHAGQREYRVLVMSKSLR